MFDFLKKAINKDRKPESTDIQRVAAAARICLASPDFKAYRERYEALEREIIEELIRDARMFSADQSSMEKFGAKCLIRLTRLYDLRSILISVVNDEKRDKGGSDVGKTH